MLIEGKNAVREALNSNTNITNVYVLDSLQNNKTICELVEIARKKNLNVAIRQKSFFESNAKTGFHQGVMAKVQDYSYVSVDDILSFAREKNEKAFILLVDEVTDPHNLGSIIRSAECAGVHGIVIPANRGCLVNETVIKVSTGAAYNMRIAKVTNINDCIRALKRENVWVYSMEADGESIYNTDFTGDIALVVGSEGFGVSSLTRKLSDGVVSLTMKGQINSLNASVACGICLYEVVRQRRN